MVLWWWKAARREVNIPAVWADDMRAVWKTNGRPNAPDPAHAPVNAFYGPLAYQSARVFIKARGHKPDGKIGHELLRSAEFFPTETNFRNRSKPSAANEKAVR